MLQKLEYKRESNLIGGEWVGADKGRDDRRDRSRDRRDDRSRAELRTGGDGARNQGGGCGAAGLGGEDSGGAW